MDRQSSPAPTICTTASRPNQSSLPESSHRSGAAAAPAGPPSLQFQLTRCSVGRVNLITSGPPSTPELPVVEGREFVRRDPDRARCRLAHFEHGKERERIPGVGVETWQLQRRIDAAPQLDAVSVERNSQRRTLRRRGGTASRRRHRPMPHNRTCSATAHGRRCCSLCRTCGQSQRRRADSSRPPQLHRRGAANQLQETQRLLPPLPETPARRSRTVTRADRPQKFDITQTSRERLEVRPRRPYGRIQ